MKKEDIYKLLDEKDVWYEITEHEAVYNMEELASVDLPYPEADAKNVFVRDDKKQKYYLITVKGNKRVDLKRFKEDYNTRKLSFVSEVDLLDKLNLTAGSVTPFGLLNDNDCVVDFYIDKDFLKSDDSIIGVHPNDNTATVWIKTRDLLNIIKEHGNSITEANI